MTELHTPCRGIVLQGLSKQLRISSHPRQCLGGCLARQRFIVDKASSQGDQAWVLQRLGHQLSNWPNGILCPTANGYRLKCSGHIGFRCSEIRISKRGLRRLPYGTEATEKIQFWGTASGRQKATMVKPTARKLSFRYTFCRERGGLAEWGGAFPSRCLGHSPAWQELQLISCS